MNLAREKQERERERVIHVATDKLILLQSCSIPTHTLTNDISAVQCIDTAERERERGGERERAGGNKKKRE